MVYHYQGGTDLVVSTRMTGVPKGAGVRGTLWDAQVGGTQYGPDAFTDDNGSPEPGTVQTDASSRMSFTMDETLGSKECWLDLGANERWRIRSWESYGPKGDPGPSGSLDGIIGAAGTVLAFSGTAWQPKVPTTELGLAPAVHGHTASQVSGLATVATSGKYGDLTGLPAASYTAAQSDARYVQPAQVDTLVAALVGGTGETGTALDGRYLRRRAQTLVVLGDSLTEQGGLRPTTPNFIFPDSLWPWAMSLTGHRLKLLANAGVGGNTTAQMLARLQGEVISLAPAWCHVLGGTNDVGQGSTASQIEANLSAIYDALDAAGIRIIAGTIPPKNDWTAADRAVGTALNSWIKAQARTRPGLVVVDYHASLTDPATGGYSTGYAQADGVHMSSRGAFAAGRLLATTLAMLVAPGDVLLTDPNDPANLLGSHGRFQGGAGSVPTGWSAGSYTVMPTWSKVPRADGIAGSWQSVVVPNGDRVFIQHNASIGAALAVGDVVTASVEYSLSGLDPAAAASTQGFFMYLQAYNGSSFTSKTYAMYWDSSKPNMPAASRSGVLTTPPLSIPSGTTLVQVAIVMNGGGTYLLDRADIRKV